MTLAVARTAVEAAVVEIDVQCKPLYEDSISPTQAYEDDAGWDLYAHHFVGRDEKENFKIDAIKFGEGCIGKIYTGIALAIPKGYVGLIFDRSGLGGRGIMRLMGVVDAGYRGEVVVKLLNVAAGTARVQRGDKIAQIIFVENPRVNMRKVDELPPSERGEKGFGSSGT